MEYKKIAIGVLVFLLVAGFASVSASGYQAVGSPSGGLPVLQVSPTWQQVNTNGFGDPQAGEVSALEAFNGYLYAGTSNAAVGARIFHSPDGLVWTPVIDPGFGITHDNRPPAILDLVVFNSKLYASTGKGDVAGMIWRTVNGTTWAPMVNSGFGDPDTVDLTALAVFNSWIYAGATNLISGAQIWRSLSGDSNTWVQVAPTVPGMSANTITGFAIFGGALYAALESQGPVQVWRSTSGADWTTVMSNGFGDNSTTSSGGMAEFAGYLYVGAGNDLDGAQLWRTSDGAIWEQAITPGFGDPNNQKVDQVFVFQNQLYVSVNNSQTGMEIWRSPDGTSWEQVNLDGFGDSHNSGSNWSNATADFLVQLYVGTSNVLDGGELWRMQEQSPPSPTPTSTPPPPPTPTPTPPPLPMYMPLVQR